jgi:hypothetical protein
MNVQEIGIAIFAMERNETLRIASFKLAIATKNALRDGAQTAIAPITIVGAVPSINLFSR